MLMQMSLMAASIFSLAPARGSHLKTTKPFRAPGLKYFSR